MEGPSLRIVSVVLIQLVNFLVSGSNLELVHIVYRHGARSPIQTFPTDPNRNLWKKGFGQLTKRGMAEHFRLGQFFKARYAKDPKHQILSGEYNSSEIVINSTNVDRTLMSAQANLAGLYPPSPEEMFEKTLPWQPIPVHTKPLDEDYILNTDAPCPKAEAVEEEILNSPDIQQEEKKNKKFYQFVSNKTGVPHEGIRTVWSIYDSLECAYANNFTLPDWVYMKWEDTTVFHKLQKLDALEFDLRYTAPELKRLKGGPLLKTIIQNMRDFVAGKLTQGPKVFMYSAHDSTVAALLSAMDIYDTIPPTFAAAVMIELYNDNGKYNVKIYYQNDTVVDVSSEPYQLVTKGCTEESCELETFAESMKKNIPHDRNAECRVNKLSKVMYFIIGGVAALLVVITILITLICCIRKRQRKYSSYYGLSQDG